MTTSAIAASRLLPALLALGICVLGATTLTSCRKSNTPTVDPGPPGVARVIDRGIEAMGGRDAFAAIESIYLKGTNQTPIGNFFFDLYQTRPHLGLIAQSNPGGFGVMTIGCDGTTTWTINPLTKGVPQITENDTLWASMAQLNLYERILDTHETYTLREPAGEVSFANAMCEKIRMVRADGIEHFWYFEIDSGRLKGIEDTRPTSGGPMEVTRRFSNWQEYGDLTLWTKMETEQQGGLVTTVLYSQIEINTVDPKVYELPDDVKALVEGAASRPGQ